MALTLTMDDAESFYSCDGETAGDLEQQQQQGVSMTDVFEILSEMSITLKEGTGKEDSHHPTDSTAAGVADATSTVGVQEDLLLGRAAAADPSLPVPTVSGIAPASPSGGGTLKVLSIYLHNVNTAVDSNGGDAHVSDLSSRSSSSSSSGIEGEGDKDIGRVNNYSFDSYKYSYNSYRESFKDDPIQETTKHKSSSSSRHDASAVSGDFEESFVFDRVNDNSNIEIHANYDIEGTYDEFLEVIGDRDGAGAPDNRSNFGNYDNFGATDNPQKGRDTGWSSNTKSNTKSKNISRSNNISKDNDSYSSISRGSFTTAATEPVDISGISSIYQRIRPSTSSALSPPLYGSVKKSYKYIYDSNGHKIINPDYSGCSSSGAGSGEANNSLFAEGSEYCFSPKFEEIVRQKKKPPPHAARQQPGGERPSSSGSTNSAPKKKKKKSMKHPYVNDYTSSSPYKASVVKMEKDQREYARCKLVLLRRIRRIRSMVTIK